MNTKKVVITGANSGIGKAAAIKFASEGFQVIMACRNMKKGKNAREEVISQSGTDNVDLIKLDVSSFDSIRRFNEEYRDRYDIPDNLIHNAAYFNHGEKEYQESADNIELTFATNVLGPFMLIEIFKDLLEKSDDPRILNACSTNIKHFFDPKRQIEFDNLQGEFRDSRPYSVYKLYSDSKIALLMLTFRWAEEFRSHGIKVNAVMISNIRNEWQSIKKVRSWYRVAAALQNLIAAPATMMADVYYHICTSEEFKNVSGKLINHRKEIVQCSKLNDNAGFLAVAREIKNGKTYPKYAETREVQESVWNLCRNLIEE
ncbi:SDR family NAD(P)-dependent oxidoreductase [soil metagenome]